MDVIKNVAISSSVTTWNVNINHYCVGDIITDDSPSDQFLASLPGIEECALVNALECNDCENDVCDISVNCSATDPECNENTPSGTIMVTVSNANVTCGFSGTGVTYILCDSQGQPIGSPGVTEQEQYTFTGLSAGSYTVKVEDAAGCKDECSVNLLDASLPDCSATNDGPLTCIETGAKASVILDGSSTTQGVTYQWTESSSIPIDTVGVYTLMVTAPNGCISTCETTVGLDNTVPVCTADNDGPLCCDKTTVNLIGGADGVASYSWSGPDNFSAVTQNTTTTVAGEYTLTVTAS
ncbi:MAG: hypothetical protein COA88_03850 [Kordia sp.]|nr:MAG: hypothetical protein COA88_03850 [Kordia sp.]